MKKLVLSLLAIATIWFESSPPRESQAAEQARVTGGCKPDRTNKRKLRTPRPAPQAYPERLPDSSNGFMRRLRPERIGGIDWYLNGRGPFSD
jgi:hypothetical protein